MGYFMMRFELGLEKPDPSGPASAQRQSRERTSWNVQ
jgi:hypothetical protein